MKKQNLRYMKWIGKMIVLLFIFNFQFSIFDCSAQRVSLDECLEKALESNFSIKIIRNEARMDKNNLNYSTFLPTLEGTAKQTQTRNDKMQLMMEQIVLSNKSSQKEKTDRQKE